MTKLKVLDLFSGIGGFSLGLKRAVSDGPYTGFETVAFCEIEPFPRKVLAKHWPEVPCYDDVRTLTAERLATDGIAVDVICGGFPCQDISRAGKKAGISAGTRSGLWSEIARLIGELRPSYAIVENVAAIISNGLGTVIGDLAALGYDAEWHCIPAYYVGSPQTRDRAWIVAYPMQQGCAGRRSGGSGRGQCRSGKARQIDWPRIEAKNVQLWPEPEVGRVFDGFPREVDAINALGNAVVPQIPELIGNAILAAHK